MQWHTSGLAVSGSPRKLVCIVSGAIRTRTAEGHSESAEHRYGMYRHRTDTTTTALVVDERHANHQSSFLTLHGIRMGTRLYCLEGILRLCVFLEFRALTFHRRTSYGSAETCRRCRHSSCYCQGNPVMRSPLPASFRPQLFHCARILARRHRNQFPLVGILCVGDSWTPSRATVGRTSPDGSGYRRSGLVDL